MGIPSYFSYIIKNHSNIIRNIQFHKKHAKTTFHGLYMDCNSIIYDAVHTLEKQSSKYNRNNRKHFEQSVIDAVVIRIREYINTISPTNVLFIAFDGVAPLAKMDQQRSRRYKTAFMSAISFENPLQPFIDNPDKDKWNTSAITPGTSFMSILSRRIHAEFNGPSGVSVFGNRIPHVIVSTSVEPGEGEHKMFAYMRTHVQPNENIAVYGLDSDLIMLSILHSVFCRNIFIFRETPQFSKNILPAQLRSDTNDLLFLDIRELTKSILNEMKCAQYNSPTQVVPPCFGNSPSPSFSASLTPHSGLVANTQRIYDYILISVLLGNDFLPHMISLNLRGTGMDELLQMYAEHITKRREYLVSEDRKIIWKNVKYFIGKLALSEHRNIVDEYAQHAKLAKRKYPETTPEEREFVLQKTPTIYRGDEEYICPTEEQWEARYYRVCFPANPPTLMPDKDVVKDIVKDICINYIEGLEWVFRYYSEGCPHWRWKYRFHYPPLLADLCKHIPETKNTVLGNIRAVNRPFHPHVQLSYVLPQISQYLIPQKTRDLILQPKFLPLFVSIRDIRFSWLFCKYFWESHVILPEISMTVLEEWERTIHLRG
jgi:5'-3' exoribonuclease 2